MGRERPLWEGHRARLRQRVEREGWDSLKPHEVVELVLYHAVPRQDISDMARLLVDRFGSVGGVFSASREQLASVPGVTGALAEWVALTGELMRAYYDVHGLSDIHLSCYQEAVSFLRSLYWRAEVGLWAIYVDFEFSLITCSCLNRDAAWLDYTVSRQILAEAIGNGARYVFLVRWTEAAPLTLSEAELTGLEALAITLRAAEMDLVDCLLVAGETIHSMNHHGDLNGIWEESGYMQLHERYG